MRKTLGKLGLLALACIILTVLKSPAGLGESTSTRQKCTCYTCLRARNEHARTEDAGTTDTQRTAQEVAPDMEEISHENAGDTLPTETEIDIDMEMKTNPIGVIFGDEQLQYRYSQEVKHLQIYLNVYMRLNKCETSLDLTESGIFDKATDLALRRFQIDQGVSEIGVAGEETKAKLFDLMGNMIY